MVEGGILGEAGRVNAREDGGCKRKREGGRECRGRQCERELNRIEGLAPNRHSAQHSTVSRLAGFTLFPGFTFGPSPSCFCLHIRTHPVLYSTYNIQHTTLRPRPSLPPVSVSIHSSSSQQGQLVSQSALSVSHAPPCVTSSPSTRRLFVGFPAIPPPRTLRQPHHRLFFILPFPKCRKFGRCLTLTPLLGWPLAPSPRSQDINAERHNR